MQEHPHSKALCADHLHVAHEEARRINDDDALSECYMALVEAAASWDDTHGLSFERWARHLMRTRVRRRLMDKRVIRVPWRVRQKLAATMSELEKEGRDVTERAVYALAPDVVSASWAVRPTWIGHLSEEPAAQSQQWQEPPRDASWVLALRYGYDGGGMRSAREVAILTGRTPEAVLLEEAEFLRDTGVGQRGGG